MLNAGQHEAQLGVRMNEVTLLFSDIAGFTTIAEAMDPNELLMLLSDYFTLMAVIIQELGGTLLEFIGDAILAIWNAPQKTADHPRACVEAALRMQETLDRMVGEWSAKGYPPIRIRVGISWCLQRFELSVRAA